MQGHCHQTYEAHLQLSYRLFLVSNSYVPVEQIHTLLTIFSINWYLKSVVGKFFWLNMYFLCCCRHFLLEGEIQIYHPDRSVLVLVFPTSSGLLKFDISDENWPLTNSAKKKVLTPYKSKLRSPLFFQGDARHSLCQIPMIHQYIVFLLVSHFKSCWDQLSWFVVSQHDLLRVPFVLLEVIFLR